MKRIVVLFCCLILILNINHCYATTQPQPQLQVSSNSANNTPRETYYDFYIWDSNDFNLNMELKNYSKTLLKYFSKDDRKLYKKCLKYDKDIKKGYFSNVLHKQNGFLPAVISAYKYYDTNKKTRDAVLQWRR